MNRIDQKEFLNRLKELSNKTICLTLKGAFESKITINRMYYKMGLDKITLRDSKGANSVIIYLNQIYGRLINEQGNRLQVSIDSANEDIVTVIEVPLLQEK